MQPNQEEPIPANQQKPVAYDTMGRPLYAAPVALSTAQPPQVVHYTRAISPEEPEVSPEMQARHDESVKRYPTLNLSKGEYVVSAVRRHPIGLVIPIAVTVLLLAIIAAVLIDYPLIAQSMELVTVSYGSVLVVGLLLLLLVGIGGYIVIWVYLNNKFYLTNESVIQEIQISLFAKREQTISLENIEDASYRQQGILQMLLNYGSIRLSTEGDETTYRFPYVYDPKTEIAKLNNAVEAFKNGRPVNENEIS